ncbi:MAG: hypothetical protein KDI79_17620, partial [Anaerolineae bacterium]|nr:hypothetical protein [Anaerolineae bacterium]
AWHGIVLDVFKNDMGRTVLRVQTVRNIFRKLGPELIEVDIAPDQITPATHQDLLNEINLHQKMQKEVLEQFLAHIENLPVPPPEKV